MFLRSIVVLVFLLSQPSFCLPELPRVIDLGYRTRSGVGLPTWDGSWNIFWKWGLRAFNSAPEYGLFVAACKEEYRLDVVIETGTFEGDTAILLSYLFDTVHTIEVSEVFYEIAKNNLALRKNVVCHMGRSEGVLAKLLPTLKHQRLLFYLDAHWEEYWPLLDELEEISKTHRDRCVIIIDDFKVPSHSHIGYDSYAGKECSLEYIQSSLDKIFTEYHYCYLIPRDVDSRAKCVIFPKAWVQK
jgi:predicted O-methyltransferase YrrM